MKFFVSAALMLLSFSANANLLGNWAGIGRIEGNRINGDCDKVTVDITLAGTKLEIKEHWYRIGGSSTGLFAEITLDISGSEVWFKGQRIGTISDNSMLVDFKSEEGMVKGQVTVDGGKLIFDVEVKTFKGEIVHRMAYLKKSYLKN